MTGFEFSVGENFPKITSVKNDFRKAKRWSCENLPKLREIKEPELPQARKEVKIKRLWKEIKFEKSGTIKGSESEILPVLRLENSKKFS